MAYLLLPRPIQERCCSLAVHLVLVISISLLPIQIQALPSVLLYGEKAATQEDSQAQRLEPGKSIERELTGGQSHSYRITMASGQYLQVLADQRGIDVVLALFAPDGQKVIEVDSPNGMEGPETISTITEEAGIYRIEVRSLEKAAQTGRYEIKVEELRVATAEDMYRVAAESIFQKAKQLEKGTLDDRKKSLATYHEALELYRRAGDRKGEAQTLNDIAVIHSRLGEMQKALDKYNEALPVRRAAGDRQGEAVTLSDIGVIYLSLGEIHKALEKFNESLPIVRALGDRSNEASMLYNIGAANLLLGEMQKSLEIFNEALRLRRAVSKRGAEVNILNSIGYLYSSLGEMQKALDIYDEALLISRATGARDNEARVLNNIGYVYDTLGERQKALEKYDQSLLISRAIGDRRAEATMLNNIGAVYRELGEMEKALEKYTESLTIRREIGDRSGESNTITNIGAVYQALGEMEKALEKYRQSLPISRATGDRRMEAIILHSIGQAHLSLGETQEALDKFNEALPIRRAVGDSFREADTLLGIALVEQKRGNLIQARQTIEQAVGIIESLRSKVGSQELRASYFASRQKFYQSYIDVLMQMHRQNPAAAFDASALAVSERARARSLLELLTEARADIRRGVDKSLLERERSLRQRLTARAAAQIGLLNRKHTPAQAEAAAKEIASITAEYEEVESQIRTSSPRYAALTQPQPLNLSEIQQQVLDPETLLLEYSLGENASYLFVISQTSITSHQLPKRSEIETATRQVRELLTAPQPRPGDTAAKHQARIREARANYWPQAAALSRMLLGPAATQLGSKRLLIVSDGALQYLPFGALPVPEIPREEDKETRRQGDKETGRRSDGATGRSNKSSPRPSPFHRKGTLPISPTPLIVEHEIVHLPSASTLAVLRRELAGRKPAPKTVAVLADPVFSADDARVKPTAQNHKPQAAEEAPSNLTRALTDVRSQLTRLLMTRDEAQAILSLTPPDSRLGALDFRASRATSTSDELSQYRIVHFATHGLLNSQHPKLSGLVLSLVDERGQPQDGFLQLHEIFNLRLPAELVVLSACQTGLGKEIKGEGLVGLTRGFMYAGAARVAASLWKVDDTATSELMKRFYRGMLQEGRRPAAALRAAQVEMWKRPQWKSPYYWGAFVLQGEWK
jgi:tetratricopeptide (TPR) repeat protein